MGFPVALEPMHVELEQGLNQGNLTILDNIFLALWLPSWWVISEKVASKQSVKNQSQIVETCRDVFFDDSLLLFPTKIER